MRALKPLLLVLAAVTVGVVIGIVVLTRGDDDGSLASRDFGSLASRSMEIQTAVIPRTHVFGDPVTAQADFLVDPRRVDPDTIRVDAVFDPFTRVGDVERVETRAGDLVRVRYRFHLACLAPACAPTGDTRQIDVQSGQVFFQQPGRGGRPVRTQDTVSWPPFTVVSRLGAFDATRARWRAATGTMPEVSYRIEPGTLAALLGLGSVLLLGLAGVLLTTLGPVRLRRERVVLEAPRELTPLERALELVRATSRNGAAGDHRMALERLSRELLVVGEPTLAGRARQLAWSSDRADGNEVERLTGDVRAARAEKEPST